MLYLASDADDGANEEADGANNEEADAAKEELPGANGNTEDVMFPRGKPRIILFIDDLDRCDEPDKVVEVLEAMQLLVKTDLFVVVPAIDLRLTAFSGMTRMRITRHLWGTTLDTSARCMRNGVEEL